MGRWVRAQMGCTETEHVFKSEKAGTPCACRQRFKPYPLWGHIPEDSRPGDGRARSWGRAVRQRESRRAG